MRGTSTRSLCSSQAAPCNCSASLPLLIQRELGLGLDLAGPASFLCILSPKLITPLHMLMSDHSSVAYSVLIIRHQLARCWHPPPAPRTVRWPVHPLIKLFSFPALQTAHTAASSHQPAQQPPSRSSILPSPVSIPPTPIPDPALSIHQTSSCRGVPPPGL